ncbi:MAG: NfeD family protein [Bacilli bacterium]|jgi:membrane protein implicated in regulation of membrane protease activity
MILTTILPAINILWILLIVGTIVIELSTQELDCIWFSAGAFVALILSLVGVESIVIQVVVFLVVSCILLFTIGRWANKVLRNRGIATNIEAAIGQEVVVIKAADHLNYGEGKYAGLIYTLICREGQRVDVGDIAIITEISGNKFYVVKKEEI